ncbi:hypothetical protein [Methylobacterium sp. JK268]
MNRRSYLGLLAVAPVVSFAGLAIPTALTKRRAARVASGNGSCAVSADQIARSTISADQIAARSISVGKISPHAFETRIDLPASGQDRLIGR